MGGNVDHLSDAELMRRLGLAVRRASAKRATPVAQAEVLALRAELAGRLADGRDFDWSAIGIAMKAAPRREAGSVYRRADGRWVAEITIDGTRTRRICDSEKDGRETIKGLLERHEAGIPMKDSTLTVGQMAEHVADVVMAGRRPRTITIFKESLALTGMDDRRLISVGVADVRSTLAALTRKGYSPNSVRMSRAALHKVFAVACDDGVIAMNPVTKVKGPRLDKVRETRVIEVAEARALIAYCAGDDYWGDLISLMLLTGMRRGEALGLRWADVDLDAATLRVVQQVLVENGRAVIHAPKTTNSVRTIALSPTALATLKRRRVRQAEQRLAAADVWRDEGLVHSTGIGSRLHPDNLTGAVGRLSLAAIGRKLSPHDLRHGYVTLSAVAGVPVHVVQAAVGHKSPMMTLGTYSHVLGDQAHEGAAALDALIG
jgi:integrase